MAAIHQPIFPKLHENPTIILVTYPTDKLTNDGQNSHQQLRQL